MISGVYWSIYTTRSGSQVADSNIETDRHCRLFKFNIVGYVYVVLVYQYNYYKFQKYISKKACFFDIYVLIFFMCA